MICLSASKYVVMGGKPGAFTKGGVRPAVRGWAIGRQVCRSFMGACKVRSVLFEREKGIMSTPRSSQGLCKWPMHEDEDEDEDENHRK